MKNLFRGFYKLTEKEIQTIWDNGFISFDTNVLLNFYRYSEDNRKELIRIIKKYASQLWLTHHVAFEFHKNRISVISEQISIYDETIKSFKELETKIVKNLKAPHLNKIVLRKFEKTIKEIISELEKRKESYKKLLLNDTILSAITSAFNKKVGRPFTNDEKTKIEKEGEDRYKKKVPPGFKDDGKDENKFGDLIIWKELLRKAKAEKKPFILIIDDLKEDWWLRVQGQTISPRPELLQELYDESGQTFHLYTLDRFLEFASKTDNIKQEAIDEAREIRINDNSFQSHSGLDIDLMQKFYNSSIVGSEAAKLSEMLNSAPDFYKKIGSSAIMNELLKDNNTANLLKFYAENNPLNNLTKHFSEVYSKIPNFNQFVTLQDTYKKFFGSDMPHNNEERKDQKQRDNPPEKDNDEDKKEADDA